MSTVEASHQTSNSRWAFVPIGLLAAMLLGLGSMAAIAMDDPGFALERDYYQKAVRWNDVQAQAEQNSRLGYKLELTATTQSNESELELRLRNAEGAPLSGAHITAEAFAVARSANVRELSFHETAPGTYAATPGALRAGLWEIRCRVERNRERFTHTLRAELPLRTKP